MLEVVKRIIGAFRHDSEIKLVAAEVRESNRNADEAINRASNLVARIRLEDDIEARRLRRERH